MMGDKTGIEWTDATWNPVVGCSKVSPGCDNCYAIGQAERIVRMGGKGGAKYEGTVEPGSGEWTGVVRCVPDVLDQPLRWKKPRRIFVNSMSDLFHPDVPDDFIEAVFGVMGRCPQHTFQILTKRTQRMAEFMNHSLREAFCWHAPKDYIDVGPTIEVPLPAGWSWPLPNVWLGTSIESNRYAFRADHLRNTSAAVRWISAEPLLGPLDQLDLDGIDWIVAGGESGPGARPMHPDWAHDIRKMAQHAGASFHFKQWGNWAPIGPLYDSYNGGDDHSETADDARTEAACLAADHGDDRVVQLERNGCIADGYQPGDNRTWLMFRNASKKTAGRELDGRTWDEYPAAVPSPAADLVGRQDGAE